MSIKHVRWLLVLACLGLSSCFFGSDDRPDAPQARAEQASDIAVLAGIQSNVAEGLPGTVFRLNAVGAADSPSTTYRWTLSDGRAFDTRAIELSFTDPGAFEVTLEIQSGADTTRATAMLIVHATDSAAPAALGLARIVGDSDGNGSVDLSDALLNAQSQAGLRPRLLDEHKYAADMDLNGRIDANDLALQLRAVADGQPLPDGILQDQAYPGQLLMLVSPWLKDPAATVEISVNGEAAQHPGRTVLGYAVFHVPFATQAGTTASVSLKVNGQIVGSYAVPVAAAPAFSGLGADAPDPKAAVLAILDRIGVLADQSMAAATAHIARTASPEDTQVLSAIAIHGQSEFKASRAELQRLLDSPQGAQLARVLLKALIASGAGELTPSVPSTVQDAARARPQAETAQALSVPNQVCDELIPALCAVKTSFKALEVAGDTANTTCGVLWAAAVVAIAVPLDGPVVDTAALISAAAVCSRAAAAVNALNLVSGLISDFTPSIEVTASPDATVQGTPATVKAFLRMAGNDEICALGSSAGEETFTKTLKRILVTKTVRTSMVPAAVARAVSVLPDAWQTKFWNAVAESYANAVGSVLNSAGVGDALGRFASPYCASLSSDLLMDASRVVTPPSDGIFQPQPDGTALYHCPPPGPIFEQTAKLEGSYAICGETKRASATVTCNGNSATITMGDNGSALDDIYEVEINGTVVLTSNAPVRSTSATVQLPNGFTDILMRGRAAPDGVGTYFFSITGATYAGGDPLSGTDLTPGKTKRFTVTVP